MDLFIQIILLSILKEEKEIKLFPKSVTLHDDSIPKYLPNSSLDSLVHILRFLDVNIHAHYDSFKVRNFCW